MSIDFKLKDFAYPGYIFRMRRKFEESQYYSPVEMEEYQMARVRRILHHAGRDIPYYREAFKKRNIEPETFSSLSDLSRLPRLNKRILQNKNSSLIARNASRFQPKKERTSGTSGAPCPFLSDRYSRALEFVFYWRHWSWAGYKLGQRFAELNSHYFVKSAERVDQFFSPPGITGRMLLNSLKLSPDSVNSYLDAIRKFRPKYLKGVASALYFFAYWMEVCDVRDVSFQAVFSTGEKLTEGYRSLIERVFHCKVMDTYGHMERTAAVSQCPVGGYHINSDYGILEIDRTDLPPDGDLRFGRVLGTSLYNKAMPLIRYEVDDLIEIFEPPVPECKCGRKLPLIKSIYGRHEDYIVTPEDRIITSIYIASNIVKGYSFAQYIQNSKDRLLVNLIKDSEFVAADEERFLAVLRNFVGPHMKVDIRYITPREIFREESGKVPIVKSSIKSGV
ncbi:phenylacetate--CoA ligase family protein [Acidobacteriota bacterium]